MTDGNNDLSVKEELKLRAKQFDEMLREYLSYEKGYTRTLQKAMNYSLLAGGKRLRPILMEEMYHAFGGKGTVIVPFMAAIEMIHTYSLVHDDLPAMDNDDLRRGKPTTHKQFGEAMGVLCGDALLNEAIERALSAFYIEPDNPNLLPAVRLLFQKSGIRGMIGGQCVDVEGEKNNVAPDEDKLYFIYENKTAALIEAAMMIGALLAGANDTDVSRIEKAASKLGIAFQIQDDILDITGDEAVIGKPTGSDERNEKVTMVTFLGLEKAKQEVETLTEEAVSIILSYTGEETFLPRLFRYLVYREN